MRTAVVQALEHYLPVERLTNEQLADLYPNWPAEKILSKTGIRERAIAAKDECASDLAVRAVDKLLARTNVPRESIDLLVLCTQSPDYFLPTTACILQDRLGFSSHTAAFDINLGCSGYPYGLAVVRGMLEAGVAHNAIFVVAETYSRYINPMDKSVRTLFGDAASATLVNVRERAYPSIGPFVLGTDGSGAQNLIVPRGGLRKRYDPALRTVTDKSGNERTENDLYMNGPAIFEFTARRIPEVVGELLRRAGMRPDQIDHYVFHQANEYMLRYLQRKLAIPDDKFVVHFAHCGNTVSATIPIALQSLVDSGRLRRGGTLMLVGFGVGYSWGGALLRWEPDLS